MVRYPFDPDNGSSRRRCERIVRRRAWSRPCLPDAPASG